MFILSSFLGSFGQWAVLASLILGLYEQTDSLCKNFDSNFLAGQQSSQYALLLNEVFPSQNRRYLKKAYR
jgi:hypothetical protein